ncbi:hypothetical protein V6N12_017664 [Hibiscus sabdariffa]|uniref:Heme O synthase n=1 Tax=Hibiscus sabdariffa TaxID=183260 RepID=A0ABR2CGV7_9ROSI
MWRSSATLSFSSRLLSSSSIFTPNAVLGFIANKSDAFRPLSFKASDAIQLARHYGRCYWELSKARLSMLVVATSGTGYVLGSGNAVDLAGLCCTCAGTMMVAASANSLNQDALQCHMQSLGHLLLDLLGLLCWHARLLQANMLAAGLAASNLVLYAFVYTPLKQIHPVNTWVGAIVGAIPPLLGWAAASGQISLNGLILPAALYFWQIPHFMALAYLCRDDYAAGGYKMFSLADASGRRTSAVAFRNCLYLVPLGFIAYDWGVASGWFCLESSLITLAISAAAFSFYRDRTTQKARRMFYASLLYLPVFMSGLLFHRLSNDQQSIMENTDRIAGLSSFPEDVTESGKDDLKKKSRYVSAGLQGRPPVAYASIAPFPFLPVPSYVDQ